MRQRMTYVLAMTSALLAGALELRAAGLIGQSEAARGGLHRAWYAQVGSLQSTGPVNYLNLSHGVVLAQTTGGMVTAIDAETGGILWADQIGPRGRLTSEAAANDQYIAVINGSQLYVLERATGNVVWERRTMGVPGSGPAVSHSHVFVPMIDGQIEGHALDGSTRFFPWIYKSSGRILISPMTTPQTVSWTTERGYLYVADPSGGGVRFRLETNDAIAARPGYWSPHLYAGSINGFIYAVDEQSGRLVWKSSVGDAVHEPPVAIGDKVFVVSQIQGMTCLDARTGHILWRAGGVAQFLSASPTRVYVRDKTSHLAVLDIEQGTWQASFPLRDMHLHLTNPHSDRIYLASATGTVQCLHELGQRTPVLHTPPPPQERALPVLKPKDAPADAPVPSDDMPAAPTDSPFSDADPADVFDGDDPFATP